MSSRASSGAMVSPWTMMESTTTPKSCSPAAPGGEALGQAEHHGAGPRSPLQVRTALQAQGMRSDVRRSRADTP